MNRIFKRSQHYGSLLEQDLANTAGDLTAGSRTLELQPRQQQTCGQACCHDEEAHRDTTFPGVFTAQCTLVHLRGLAIACRLSVRPSVRL